MLHDHLTRITGRNVGITGVGCTRDSTFIPVVLDASDPIEDLDDMPNIDMETQHWCGWRCSYTDPKLNDSSKKRHELNRKFTVRPNAATKLPESTQSKSVEDIKMEQSRRLHARRERNASAVGPHRPRRQ